MLVVSARLRPARAADRDAVLTLSEQLAGPFPLPSWRTREMVAEGDKPALRRFFDAPPAPDAAMLVVAEMDDGPLAGFVFAAMGRDFFDGAPSAHLEALVVDAPARGAGLGAVLLGRFEAWAREAGARYATLNVLEGNGRARSVYEAGGFAAESRRMVKPLD